VRTVEKKAAAARYLYDKEDWDFFIFVLGETDAASHRFWRFHDPHSPLRDDEPHVPQATNPMLTIYQKADEVIGQFLSLAAQDTTVMVMSDHGNGGDSDKAVYLNRWLERQGLLKFRPIIGSTTIGVEFVKQLGLKVLPPKIKTLLFRMTNIPNMMESWARFSAIDWKRTRAFSEETPYFPSIWINLKGREPLGIVEQSEHEMLCEHLIAQLTLWRNPYTGQRMVKRVYRRDEIYSGPHVAQAPDLTIEWEFDNGYSYLFRPSIGRRKPPVCRLTRQEKKYVKSGDHRDHGIFLATGPQLIPPTEVKELELVDLAPTVLYLLGLPIPAEMDGQVATQLFAEEYLTSHPIRYEYETSLQATSSGAPRNYSPDEEAAIRTRLQGLGYIE
jgi:predicted AlkP superfamily phosphohydrolase/phosphomutase